MFSIPMKVMSPSLKTSVHGFDRGGDCTVQPTFNGFLTYI